MWPMHLQSLKLLSLKVKEEMHLQENMLFDLFIPPSPHHTFTIRQCMFSMKKGADGSVLQELCHFVVLNVLCMQYCW